ncbi:MAG: PAS domain S-box protein [Nitrospiraceae bacterium]|nr:PAS domain S-box protein [Nitrospiraceae bacterium]
MTDNLGFAEDAHSLAMILDTMAEGLYVVDRDGVVQRWNPAMERMSGYSAEEAVGRPCALLNCETCPEEADVPAQCRLFQLGEIDNVETTIQRKDGKRIAVLKSARVLHNAQGEAVGTVETLTDISSVRLLQREVSRLRGEIEERFEFHNIIGKSPGMREVFSQIEMAAASEATILIQGETGTGKELVAKAIHYHSERKDGPLVTVNCSALSESLLESELFGHVQGAFTGAVKDYIGRFERAHGGTVFLDEVGELPPNVQVKLLRVLQEREFERVGESTPRPVDVRVIAATHRDLRERVREGAFREDLFYRLKVFPIHLPPLRERKEDIGLLLRRFIDQFNERTGKHIEGLSPDALRIVLDYCWRGNVRELENAVEHAFVTCPGGEIGPFDLPVEVRRVELANAICRESAPANAPPPASTPRRAKPTSREELIALLDECAWNKAEAARRLGLTRTSVWRRMKKLGIPLDATD